MSQVAPPVDPRTISTPVVISAGGTVQIPYPTNATQIVMWVVLYNSSPYTIAVESDTTLGQVAAFSSDAFPVVSGTPITCTALLGAGAIAPGSDTSIYATWYQQPPPGTFPAALGSGEANFAVPTTIVPVTAFPLGIGATVVATGGVLPTAGYGGATYRVSETTGFGTLEVVVLWFDNAAGTHVIATRRFMVPSAGQAVPTIPHFGPYFAVYLLNVGGTAISATVFVNGVTLPLEAWSISGLGVSPAQEYLLQGVNVPIVTSGTAIIASSVATYAGPATWINFASQFTATHEWQLQAWNPTSGTWDILAAQNPPGPGRFCPPINLMIPPLALRVFAFNAAPTTQAFFTNLVADDWRVGT